MITVYAAIHPPISADPHTGRRDLCCTSVDPLRRLELPRGLWYTGMPFLVEHMLTGSCMTEAGPNALLRIPYLMSVHINGNMLFQFTLVE
jgi:hypothetical protein